MSLEEERGQVAVERSLMNRAPCEWSMLTIRDCGNHRFDQPSQSAGAWLVEMAVIAVIILLVGHRVGYAISLGNLAIAVSIATVAHFAGRELLRFILRSR